MFADEPEMAERWADHTPDTEGLPERVEETFAHDEFPDPEEAGQEYRKTGAALAVRMDEPFDVDEGLLREITPEDDPDLDPDELEDMLDQLGDFTDEDEDEKEDAPPSSVPRMSRMAALMKGGAAPAPWSPEAIKAEFGYDPSNPAEFDLPLKKVRRRAPRRPARYSAVMKALAQLSGERPPGASPRDLGASIPHNHPESEGWRESCPACSWSTSFDDPFQYSSGIIEALKGLGEFTLDDAVEIVRELPEFQVTVATPIYPPCENCGSRRRTEDGRGWQCVDCGSRLPETDPKIRRTQAYSDTRLPGGFRNLRDLIQQTIKGSGYFEPVGEDWSKRMFSPTAARKVKWRYTGAMKEEKVVSQDGILVKTQYAPESDPEAYLFYRTPLGYHVLTPSDNEQWFGTPELRDNYTQWHSQISGTPLNIREVTPMSEATGRPLGSRPFQDWSRLGQVGSELKRQSDAMRGSVYQTQDGRLHFYKDQMAAGEQPMEADMTQGVWVPRPTQGTGQMQSVFSPKI
jgi:hypothetical protein